MKLRTLIALMAVCIITALVAPAFSQEMPAVGTKIDKNNYKKYMHLFPDEFGQAFVDGFSLIPPVYLTVGKTIPIVVPKEWLDYSAKNKGKYGLDAQGDLTGGYNREGLPFPGLQKGDKDFATKFMWNYDCRWTFDENKDLARGGSYEKRKGEPARYNNAHLIFLAFKGRMVVNPKPDLPNPIGLYKAFMVHYIRPDSVKNTINLTYRYADPKKTDDTYLYLPAMRRVLRAESGQRSTPLLGNIAALDDMWGHDGRVPEFTYTLVKEQKVLAITDNKTVVNSTNWKSVDLPFYHDGWEVRDTYVIDIKAKDPKYPQGKKRIWIDKEDGASIYYAIAWDRQGKLWKIWTQSFKRHPMLGQQMPVLDGVWGVDIQFGMSTFYAGDIAVNNQNYTYNDWTTSNLLKIAR